MTARRNAKISEKSQGGKTVTCVRCSGEIQPYAGRAVALLSGVYAHHPGKCQDRAEQAAKAHAWSQDTMFGWLCAHVEPSYTGRAPECCHVTGGDREEFAEHMKSHGKRPLTTEPVIRLRAKPAAAQRQVPRVPAFKRITWTQRHYADWQPGIGNERLPDTEHAGQFWANGPEANTVIVLEDRRSQGLPNRLVTLYLDGSGKLTPDWSAAKSSRRDAKRAAAGANFHQARP